MKTYSVNISGTIIVFDVSYKNNVPRADAVPDDELEIIINIIAIFGKHIITKDMEGQVKKHVDQWEQV